MNRILLPSLGLSVILCLSGGTKAEAQKPSPAEAILKKSDWNFTLQGGQKGGLRIRDGKVYPGDKRLTNVVGEAAFTDEGALYIEFYNHPKISNGQATIAKVADGKWSGVVIQPGMERSINMTRTY